MSPSSEASDSEGVGWGWVICISHKFPGKAGTSGPRGLLVQNQSLEVGRAEISKYSVCPMAISDMEKNRAGQADGGYHSQREKISLIR